MKTSFLALRLCLASFFLFLILAVRDAGCFSPQVQQTPEPQKSPAPRPAIPANVFRDRETIKFGVYATGLRVGSGLLSYEGLDDSSGLPLQHIIFRVSTLSVEDTEEVFGTPDFKSPVRVVRRIKLFGKKENIVEEYSPDVHSVEITKKIGVAEPTKQKIAVDGSLQNVLLLVYRLRNLKDLKVGGVFEIILPTQRFDLLVRDRRAVRVPLGTFDAFYLESRPPKYRIWLSTSEERIPLRLQGLIAGGAAYLAASEIK